MLKNEKPPSIGEGRLVSGEVTRMVGLRQGYGQGGSARSSMPVMEQLKAPDQVA